MKINYKTQQERIKAFKEEHIKEVSEYYDGKNKNITMPPYLGLLCYDSSDGLYYAKKVSVGMFLTNESMKELFVTSLPGILANLEINKTIICTAFVSEMWMGETKLPEGVGAEQFIKNMDVAKLTRREAIMISFETEFTVSQEFFYKNGTKYNGNGEAIKGITLERIEQKDIKNISGRFSSLIGMKLNKN